MNVYFLSAIKPEFFKIFRSFTHNPEKIVGKTTDYMNFFMF